MTPEEEAAWERSMTQCPPHHWFLGTPVAGKVKGICKRCGAKREFGDDVKVEEQSAYYKARRRGRQARWNGALRHS
jgi:hypothetical protein